MAITPPTPPLAFEDRLFELLPDPDDVGTSEYRMLYEYTQETVEVANIGGDDVADLLLSSLYELEEGIGNLRHLIEKASKPGS
jgi:hypothetical protein